MTVFRRAAAAGAALALSGLAVLGLQTPAAASHLCNNQYPPASCANVDHADSSNPRAEEAGAGERVPCEGGGFGRDTRATCDIRSTPIFLASFVADSLGVIRGEVTIPTTITPGQHTLVLTGVDPQGRPHVVRTPIRIIAAAGVPGTNPRSNAGGTGSAGGVGGVQLPRTGQQIASVTALGLGLLAAGGMAVYSGRRRRIAA